MNKNHKKEVARARVIFAVIIVLILAIVAAAVLILHNRFGKDDSQALVETQITTETETETAVAEVTTEAVEAVVVETETETETESEEPFEEKTCWVTTLVNLRQEPNTDCEVLAKIARNTELTQTGEKDGFAKVSYNDQTGYVSLDYITYEEPTTNGYVVCLDPGHQASGDSTTEPNGPNSSTMKARVTGGTSGVSTGVSEYQLTLAIGLQLQAELEARGYTVYMTRTSNDVNISNMERAQYATSVGADITVRIHANGGGESASGALMLVPSSSNPYVSSLAGSSSSLASCILTSYCAATGMANQGVQASDTMTGINWSTMPVTIIEMGYMTNPTDDVNMEDSSYQAKMVQGIANGIDSYFGL